MTAPGTDTEPRTDGWTWATNEQVAAFLEPYFAENPAALHVDALSAFREATNLPVQSCHFAQVAERLSPIPALDTAAVTAFMADLVVRGFEWVAVFWDRGWGDNGEKAEITVIQDGDGQLPLARVTPEVYRELLASGVIAPNSLQTFKARRVHDFVPERAA